MKTSLGNTIRVLEPLIILDEGHKAYSEQAQDTLRNLNPCMIVELSATPPKEANKLVVISGDELHKEEMIKLDLHVVNRTSTNWRDTMRAAMERRDDLEAKAHDYEANTNVYIRPDMPGAGGAHGQGAARREIDSRGGRAGIPDRARGAEGLDGGEVGGD